MTTIRVMPRSIGAMVLSTSLLLASTFGPAASGGPGRNAAHTAFAGERYPGTYRSRVLADDPISYWRLGETTGSVAADETGLNPGSIEGGVTRAVAPAAIGGDGAMHFDGAASSGVALDAAPATLAPQDGLTVEAWIRFEEGARGIVFRWRWYGYSLYLSEDGNVSFGGHDGGSGFSVSTASGLEPDRWHHVVGTKGDSVAKLYVDGELAAEGSASPGMYYVEGGGVAIGRDGTAFDDVVPSFSGDIDEVAVYGHVLPARRVAVHFAGGCARGIGEPSYWCSAAPKKVDVGFPELERFTGLGKIVIGAFIPDKQTPVFPVSLKGRAGPRIFRGDDRGFSRGGRVDPDRNRFYMEVDFTSRRGFVQVNPTCRVPDSGHNGTCTDPYDIRLDFPPDFGDEDLFRQGKRYRYNYVHFGISDDEKTFAITWSVAQSAEGWGMDLLRPRADGQIQIAYKKGEWHTTYRGDCFPSLEVVRWLGDDHKVVGRMKDRGAVSMLNAVSNVRHAFGAYC
ncbi:MAG: LamG domain-containing protein [Actinomycetota bacterium]|nr:LamG domain-containing protein [Actinomycetota bacterium]